MKKKEDGRIGMGVWRFLQWAAPRFVVRRMSYTCDRIALDAPCLIVSNHVTDLDPFLVGLAHKESPIAFVASEHIFRMGLISKIITALLKPIPRSKAASGASTVKSCLRRLRAGESVGLFAEGDCTWDGLTHGVFPATGKLAKAAGVPLVTFRIERGYLASPRWTGEVRRVHVHGSLVRVYSPEELKAMSAEEVTAAIDSDIYEDAWARQRVEQIGCGADDRAEGMERAFVVCPKCGGIGSLRSKDNTVFCGKCGFNAFVDSLGFFEKGSPFATPAEWEAWQKGKLRELLETGAAEGAGEPVPCVFGKIGARRVSGRKKVLLDADLKRLELIAGGERFAFDEIENMSMVRTNRLLFTSGGGYYELKCKKGVLRKYLLLWQAARDVRGEEN